MKLISALLAGLAQSTRLSDTHLNTHDFARHSMEQMAAQTADEPFDYFA